MTLSIPTARRSRHRTLGVEIGQTEIRVHVAGHSHSTPLPPGTIEPQAPLNLAALHTALAQALTALPRAAQSTKRCNVSLPGMAYYLECHDIGNVPSDYREVLESLLLTNPQEHPQRHSHGYDAAYLPRSGRDQNVGALMLSLPNDAISDVYQLLRKFGLQLHAIDAPLTAHLAQLTPSDIADGYLWLHLEANQTLLYSYATASGNQQLRSPGTFDGLLVRALPGSAHQGYAAAQHAWSQLDSLDEDRTYGLADLIVAITAEIEDLGSESNYSIEDPDAGTVSRCYLSGCGAANPTFVQLLRDHLATQYQLIPVLSSVAQALSHKPDQHTQINLNVFTKEMRRSLERRSYTWLGYAAVAASTAAVLLTATAQRLEASRLERKHAALAQQLSDLAPYAAHLKSVDANTSHLRALRNKGRIEERTAIPWQRYLGRVTDAFPPATVTLDKLELSLGIGGDADRYQGKAPYIVASLSGRALSKAAMERWAAHFETTRNFGVALERFSFDGNSFAAQLGVAQLPPDPPPVRRVSDATGVADLTPSQAVAP